MTLPKKLFTPVKIGKLEVKNRIVFPPMVTGNAGPDGMVTDKHINWYEARAKGGVGLIIVEFTYVSEHGSAGPDLLGIWHDDFIPGLKKLVEKIHTYDSKIFIQLSHGGRQTSSDYIGGTQPVAPSVIPCPLGGEIPEEISIEKIEEISRDFGEAARRAKEAGFDGVEIHGAHGYLIAEFMSPYFNKRHDSYGGDFRGRMKFPLEVIKRVRSEVGKDFPISFRLSSNEYVLDGRGIEESKRIARLLQDSGVDCLHATAGVYQSFWSLIAPYGSGEGINVADAAAFKQVVNIPIITVGRIKSPEIAEEILEQEKADMVALGRQLICDPDWPLKTAAGNFDDIRFCIGCTEGCINREVIMGKPASCIYNTEAGMEVEAAITRAETQKKVLIIGGGPGGLEAARVAALRGHQVVLFEKEKKLGGRFNLACIAPYKQEFTLLIKWYAYQMQKLCIKIELCKEITSEAVREIRPNAVIIATGAIAQMPSIPGIERQIVVSGEDVLAGKVVMGNRVVVIGGGGIGTEVADFMAQQGKKVTIVEMLPDIGVPTGIPFIVAQALIPRLISHGIELRTATTVKEIIDEGIIVTKSGREETITGIDQVVVASGVKPTGELLAPKLKGIVPEIYVIGDAKEPRSALEATHEGAEAARTI